MYIREKLILALVLWGVIFIMCSCTFVYKKVILDCESKVRPQANQLYVTSKCYF